MVLIRESELQIADHYLKNRIFSMVHFYVGQELSAAAVAGTVTREDFFFGNHRSHGHFLAKGGRPFSMFAEMLGKPAGCSGGRGGSMHLVDKSVGFMGTSPILGSILPIALGGAWHLKNLKNGNIAVAFVGDGATEEGSFYESLNLAALWKLPILIVIEDNGFAVKSTKTTRRSPLFSMERLTQSLGVDYYEATIADPLAFVDTAFKASGVVRREGKPAVLYARLPREFPHSSPVKGEGPSIGEEAIQEILLHLAHIDEGRALRFETERTAVKELVEQELMAAIQSPDFPLVNS
jgi:pyruvate dehydrogenase E1 component alpha subunit